MDRRELLRRLATRAHNIPFQDFLELIGAFGFELVRVRGSHYMFHRAGVPKLVNIQERKGQAKAYQVRQFLRLVEMYNLHLEDPG